jgi:hypothetical protein
MENDRRNFLIKASSGLAIGLLSSSPIFSYYEKIKEKPKYPDMKADVIVVGAGPGGFSAAITAARSGAKVILLEEDMMPGGAPVDMYVSFLCGGPRVGVFKEMIMKLNSDYTIGGIPNSTFGDKGNDHKNHWWLPSSFAQVIYYMINKEPNISLMCSAPVVGVFLKTSGNRNRVVGVQISRKGEIQSIYAPVIIDATGNGLVADLSGCEYMYGRESKDEYKEVYGIDVADNKVQPCTWMFISERIKRDAIFPIDKLKGSSAVEDNIDHWVNSADMKNMIQRDAGIYLQWGKTVYCKNTRDPYELALAQQNALDKLQYNLTILHEAGFAVHFAPKLGVREVRRIKGEYVLTANDLIAGIIPDDVIANAHYPLDAWGMKIPDNIKRIGPYGIPYRCLIPKGTEGLLTAGRIISATHLAHSSLRVQPICSNIGAAAGIAAAISALRHTDVRSIEISELQEKIKSMGLFDNLIMKGEKYVNK